MFSSLFGDDDEFESQVGESANKLSTARPPSPRNATGLCGLSNLGATCYLNALLQTLHFTPEFRESLFAVGENELGILSEDENADNSMVRIIPIQLQRLLANLLLLDQQSASVDALTNSFGWSNNEELQQHDVQELNRILFSAVESSLIGTSGEQLISKFYHGTSVQQIVCKKCGKISSRNEDFLDISIPVSTNDTLQQALEEQFVHTELLEAANQYRCGVCDQLVDATRSCHIDKLPLILTFALLRFCYDFNKGERYKDTSKLAFPISLDMSPYCSDDGTVMEYELYSVVIHSGSTHSGHYTAYIRDVDNLGNWTHPEDEPVQMQADPESGSVDFINFDSPLELLQTLLQQVGGAATVNKLCKAMQDQTGITWNKRFKKQHGPLNKFLKNNSDIFTIDDVGTVSIKQSKDEAKGETQYLSDAALVVQSTSGNADNSEVNENNLPSIAEAALNIDEAKSSNDASTNDKAKTKPKRDLPSVGHRWFEFNDTAVQPIEESQISKMFQGKQSAYMLFYRRKSLTRPEEALGNCYYRLPLGLQDAVAKANELLRQERQSFDLAMNTIKLHIHFSQEYVFANGALQRIAVQSESAEVTSVSTDRRKTIFELKQMIVETPGGAFHASKDLVLHSAKKLSAGLHLYNCVSGDDSLPVMTTEIKDGSHLFVWDGFQVSGESVAIGADLEPILLHISYPGNDDTTCRELTSGFSKHTTIEELKNILSGITGIPATDLLLSYFTHPGRNQQPMVTVVPSNKLRCSLAELKFSDGEKLTAERQVKKGLKTLAHEVADRQQRMVTVCVEDRISVTPLNVPWPTVTVEINKDEKLSSLKKVIFEKFNLTDVEGGGRMRADDSNEGLGPPLYENQTIIATGITSDCRIVVEPGPAPTSNQILLYFALYPFTGNADQQEVIIDRNATILACCMLMVGQAKLEGNAWHLKKTNWCGEAADNLNDEDATLSDEGVKSGDLLLMEAGRLPPKGFVRVMVHLFKPFTDKVDGNVAVGNSSTDTGVLSWLSSAVQKWTSSFTSEEKPTPNEPNHSPNEPAQPLPAQETQPETKDLKEELKKYVVPLHGEMCDVGTLEISQESTLEDLKSQLLTLPAFQQYTIPTIQFLRLRELSNNRPGKIYKQLNQSLRRHKITGYSSVCCEVLTADENLPTTSVTFYMRIKLAGAKQYGPPREVTYDTGQSGTSPNDLRKYVSNLLDMPLERLQMAKYKHDLFQWITIANEQYAAKKGGKKKNSKPPKSNIKNAPISLRDGDTVGVKDLLYDPDGDFCTESDLIGQSILEAIQEEKRRSRKNKPGDVVDESKSRRRPEVGIRIHVPDYKKATDCL